MLALVGAVVAPYFIDWTAYRDEFQREATRILGRDVVVKGEASARLLPFPSVTFQDVEVLGGDGQPLLTIDRFRMDAELAPYLSGEILIYSMALDHPMLRVPIAEDGAIGLVVGRPSIPTGARVVLEKVLVSDGTITIDNAATGRKTELTNVAATLSADSLGGPFNGSGTLTLSDAAVGFTVSTGVEQPDGSMPLRIETDHPRLDASLAIDGKVAVEAGRPRFTGTATLARPLPKVPPTGSDGADPFRLAAGDTAEDTTIGAGTPRDDRLPIRATGNLSLTPQTADLTDMRVQAGAGPQPYVLTGKGDLDLGAVPRFTLTLTGEQVDVDALAGGPARSNGAGPETGQAGNDTALGTEGGGVAGGGANTRSSSASGPASAPRGSAAPLDLSTRLEAVRRVLADVPRPTVPGTVSISLPVVTAGDTTIRDVAFKASPIDDGWAVDRFKAELPGRTTFEANGLVALDTGFGFKGDLLVASAQPSGFSDWLSGQIDPSVRALSRAGFSAKAQIGPTRQVFDDLEIDVGGNSLTGRLERAEANGATSLSASLNGKAIDLDALTALSRLLTGRNGSIAEADSFDVSLDAGPVTLRNAAADRVDASVSFDGNRLQIAKLEVAGLAGATITAAGGLSDVAGDAKGQLQLSLDAPKPEDFFAFLSRRYPGIPILEAVSDKARRLAPLKLSGEMRTLEPQEEGRRPRAPQGSKADKPMASPSLYVRLDGTANGSKIDLSTTIENGFSAMAKSGRFGLDFRLENDEPTVLLSQLGLSAIDIGPPSPLEAELSLSAAATGPIVTTASLRAPGSEASIDGTMTVTPGGITGANLSLYLSSEDAAPWLSTVAVDLGQSLDALPVDLTGSVVFDKSDWRIDGLKGQIGGTAVAADLDKPAGKPVTGEGHLAELSLPWLSGLVYGRSYGASGASRGTAGDASGWSKAAFGKSRLPTIPYSLALAVDRIDLGGAAVGNVTAQLIGTPDAVTFQDASGTIPGGNLNGRLVLRNANGVGGLTLEAATDTLGLSTLWPKLAANDTEPTLDGSIRLDGTGQSYAALFAGLTGAGKVSVSNAVAPGIPEQLFEPLLAAADAEGFKPDGGTTSALANLSAGRSFDLPSVKSSFSVTAGKARFAPASVEQGDETLTIGGSLDLPTLAVDGELTLAIDPGLDRVEGASPIVDYTLAGSLFAPTLRADVTPLSNYLSVRALEREQARVEALQERLQETLRLRREARFYRWRERKAQEVADARSAAREEQRKADEAAAQAQAQADAEAERQKALAQAAAAEADAAKARQDEAARRAEEAQAAAAARRQREADAARQAPSETPTPTRGSRPSTGKGGASGVGSGGIDFGSAGAPKPKDPPTSYPSLPGVANPLQLPSLR